RVRVRPPDSLTTAGDESRTALQAQAVHDRLRDCYLIVHYPLLRYFSRSPGTLKPGPVASVGAGRRKRERLGGLDRTGLGVDDRAIAETSGLGGALAAARDRPHLAREADLADRDERARQSAVFCGGGDG